jgi:hypothetical protein
MSKSTEHIIISVIAIIVLAFTGAGAEILAVLL